MSSNIVSQGQCPVIDSYSSYCTNPIVTTPLKIVKQNERTCLNSCMTYNKLCILYDASLRSKTSKADHGRQFS